MLDALLVDDMSNIQLLLYDDNTFKVISNSILSIKNFEGNYIKTRDTIFFLKAPYDNDFLPNKVYIKENKIILRNNKNKVIDTSYASYFKISTNHFNN